METKYLRYISSTINWLMCLLVVFCIQSCTKVKDETPPTLSLSYASFDSKTQTCDFLITASENSGIKALEVYRGDSLFYVKTTTDRSEVVYNQEYHAKIKFNGTGFKMRALVKDFANNSTEKVLEFFPSITIQGSVDTVTWQANTAHTISWTNNMAGNVRIDLYKDNKLYTNIYENYKSDSKGSIVWVIPTYIPAGSNYKIRVSSIDIGAVEAYTNMFAILPYIILNNTINSNGYQAGNAINLSWIDNVNENLKIQLFKGVNLIQTISDGTPNTFFNWTIPNNLVAGSDYKIKISGVNTGSSFAETAYFSILASPVSGTVTDIEGNVYKTITIGKQTWMVDNLKTTKYNDGTNIPNIISNSTWAMTSTPAYCWYFNDLSYSKYNYGALYNWYAVNTGKLAPVGWHVPSYDEWNTLITFLGGENIAAGKLKESGNDHWLSPNLGATNESRFNALPAGSRDAGGTFSGVGYNTSFWTSNQYTNQFAYLTNLENVGSKVQRYYMYSIMGLSVRCIKN